MTDFRKKQKRVSVQYALLGLGALVLLLVVGLLAVADVRIYRKKKELNAQLSALQSQVQALKNNNTNLQQGIAESDNPAYIEKVAREELDLQKSGEKVVSFVKPESAEHAPQATQATTVQVWLGWLAGLFKK